MNHKIAWLESQGWKPLPDMKYWWKNGNDHSTLDELPDPPYPEHTPPAAPEAMKWEYRGKAWFNGGRETVFYGFDDYTGKVDDAISSCVSGGFHHVHYFEAVPILEDPKEVARLAELAESRKKVQEVFESPPPFAEILPKGYVRNDPKGAAGALKPQLQIIPTVAMREEAKALADGATKYGPWNWRTNPVCVSTYIGAILRHTLAYRDGEDVDPESKSGVNHLGSVRACCAILLDAAENGTLVDDRPRNTTKSR